MPDGSIYTCKNHATLRWFDTKPGGALVFIGAIIGGPNGPQLKQPAYEPGSPLRRLGYYLSNRNPYAPDQPLHEPFTYERLKVFMQFVLGAEAKGYVFECECPARDLTSLPDETYEAIHALPKYVSTPPTQPEPTPLRLDDMIENLYNLERWELRKLAADALLISDGPDATVEYLEADGGEEVAVYLEGLTIDDTGELNTTRFHVAVKTPTT